MNSDAGCYIVDMPKPYLKIKLIAYLRDMMLLHCHLALYYTSKMHVVR